MYIARQSISELIAQAARTHRGGKNIAHMPGDPKGSADFVRNLLFCRDETATFPCDGHGPVSYRWSRREEICLFVEAKSYRFVETRWQLFHVAGTGI